MLNRYRRAARSAAELGLGSLVRTDSSQFQGVWAIAVVTLRVAAELERLGVEYLVGGSLASSVHGLPRTTQDVDMVARIAGRQTELLERTVAEAAAFSD